MKAFFMLIALVIPFTANAAKFKCYSSKYPSDMNHFFSDGYLILDVSAAMVNLKYYYINTNARETRLEIDANYKIDGVNRSNGALQGMVKGGLVDFKSYPGDSINTIHFTQSLFKNTPSSGVVGKFAFPGHGYSYDWNICFNLK